MGNGHNLQMNQEKTTFKAAFNCLNLKETKKDEKTGQLRALSGYLIG